MDGTGKIPGQGIYILDVNIRCDPCKSISGNGTNAGGDIDRPQGTVGEGARLDLSDARGDSHAVQGYVTHKSLCFDGGERSGQDQIGSANCTAD